MKKSKFLMFLTFSLVLSLFLTACGAGGNNNAQNGGTGTDQQAGEGEPTGPQVLNVLESAEIPTMDSVLGTDAVAFNVMNNVFEGLYRLDENDEIVEGIATTHEVNEEGTVYTFTLREDAVWSNGTPVTANDFVFAWQRAVNPETGSEYGPYMMTGKIQNATEVANGDLPIEELGVKALDDYTLEVTLEQPVAYFLSLMTFPTFYPQNQEFVEEQGDRYALEPEHLIYNGPFVLDSWEHEVGWTMKKNADYWDAETVVLDEINVKVVKEVSTGVNLYTTGNIDISPGLSSEFVTQFQNDPNLTQELEPVIFWLKLNQTRNEALANENIRRAIAMAVNKENLTNIILNNGSIPADYFIPTGFVTHPETGEDFRDEYGNFNSFNVEEAQQLWQQGLDELGVDSVTLEILGGDTESAKRMQEYFQNQFETNLPGLTIRLKEVPFAQRLQLDEQLDYDMQVAGWGPDYLDAISFANLWVTDGGNNKMGYSNEEYDQLINDVMTTHANDPAARFEAMQEAERIALEEDAAIVPLYQRGTTRLWQPYVKNVYQHNFGPDFTYKWTYITGKN
ncbi:MULTISPECIES: peptide ABC transporter substrate-binding protein [Sutcliffiella]|uniref:peptide ABC transporter substrate-binding protein n=1 Tax=Sutcliffiella TaxID=2837511 RepID=UPI0008351DDA|nr:MULTISPECIES: peptide ABC transporter substrate-binding protein [Sutcliffiella]MED4016888.1 peptide ABC transporter substrate-binding protein [Sutcliffiella cohnii]WBL16252.1 peptide ABC transporter substrate-binding protein [Sutcliffiella sp. NC1]